MSARQQQAAGLQLREMLATRGPYRRRWEAHALAPDGAIHQSAVCTVIALHLWESGEFPESDHDLSRRLKDRVSRALAGRGMSAQTLQWFVEAFGLSSRDIGQLRALQQGRERSTVIIGSLPPPSGGLAAATHETVSLHEHHFLGADGLPARHRTFHTIRALVDGLATHQYRFDTDTADVRVVRGGAASAPYVLTGQLRAVDIKFPRPLQSGETAYLEYWTVFDYPGPPPREFRRGSHGRVTNLEIRVEFHPNRVPDSIWWAQWQDYRPPNDVTISEEPVELDSEHTVQRFLDVVDRAVVGFCWEW